MKYILTDKSGDTVAEMFDGESGLFVRVPGFDPDPMGPLQRDVTLAFWHERAKQEGWTLREEHEPEVGDRSAEAMKAAVGMAACRARIHHGPGHQSNTECEKRGAHDVHYARYGEFDQEAEWRGDRAFSGYFDEPRSLEESESRQ